MRLSAFIQTLEKLDTLKFQLPNSEFVPAHFHITEVGEITRKYIDCGGIQRQENQMGRGRCVSQNVALYPDRNGHGSDRSISICSSF